MCGQLYQRVWYVCRHMWSFTVLVGSVFRNDCKGSPEVERWYRCSKNRAAQAVQWAELPYGKVGWPLVHHAWQWRPAVAQTGHREVLLWPPPPPSLLPEGTPGLRTCLTRNTVTSCTGQQVPDGSVYLDVIVVPVCFEWQCLLLWLLSIHLWVCLCDRQSICQRQLKMQVIVLWQDCQ